MKEIIVVVIAICFTAALIAAIYVRASAEARSSERNRDMFDYLAKKDRAIAEAEAQSKALQLYSLQATLDTIKAQSAAQSQAQQQTAYALTQAIDALRQDRQTVEALELMRWKAIERSFLALEDRHKKSHYWEEVSFDD